MCGFGQRAKFLMHSEDSVFETGHLLFANYINTPSGRFKVPLFITAFLQEHSLAAVPFFIFSFWKWSTWFLCLLEVELNYRNFPARRKAAPTLLWWQKGGLCKPRLMKWALKDKARTFSVIWGQSLWIYQRADSHIHIYKTYHTSMTIFLFRNA